MRGRSLLPLLLGFMLTGGCRTHFIYRIDRFDEAPPPFETPAIDLQGFADPQNRPGTDPELALAVAISGGGHRAANFAAGVLLGLESLDGNLLREVDYLSTVSGGGFPAGMFVSLLHDHLQGGGSLQTFSLREQLTTHPEALAGLRRNYEIEWLRGSFNPRLLGKRDRGDLLERRFDDHVLGRERRDPGRSMVLGDIFAANSKLPTWIPNATIYDNGARFPFAPNVLRAYAARGCIHRLRSYPLNEDGLNTPLALAVKASASFPAAIPATTLQLAGGPGKKQLQLIDGGVADNLGMQTAIEVLSQDRAPRKMLVIVDAFNLEQDPWSEKADSPGPVETAIKMTKLILETRHAHLQEDIEHMRKAVPGLQVLHIDFEDLDHGRQLSPAFIEAFQKQFPAAKLNATFKNGDPLGTAMWNSFKWSLSGKQRRNLTRLFIEHELFHLVRFMPTSLHLREDEQAFLVQAGEYAVRRNAARFTEDAR